MGMQKNDIKEIRIKIPDKFAKILKNERIPKVMDGEGGIIPQVFSFHHITVTGTSEFNDYETFGDDEHGTFGFRQETTLSTNDIGSTLLTWRKGFGGEERVEIDIEGSLASNGVLGVNIQIRFYEGATEGTTELEDSRVFQAVIPPNQTSNFNIHLANDEDDWVTVRGSIGNRKI